MIQFLTIGQFFNDLRILEIYEIYVVNSMISYYLIEQKITMPILFNIFKYGLLLLLLKIVPIWSHKVEIHFISENWKKNRYSFWQKYAGIWDIYEYDQRNPKYLKIRLNLFLLKINEINGQCIQEPLWQQFYNQNTKNNSLF